MPSFDVVSEVDLQEVENALNQGRKEIEGRYDFKGSKAEVQWDKKEKVVTLLAEDDYKVGAMLSILQTKLHRRGIDIKAIKLGEIEEAGGRMLRQKITMVQGIEREIAKDIIKTIKDSKLKVQPQVDDEKIKVSSKSIDELQECMTLLRSSDFPLPLQFNNMRP
jgi:uncharacterized protein YajQ (UPF0234 family)